MIHTQVPALNQTERGEKGIHFSSTQKVKPQELPRSTQGGCWACSLSTCLSCPGGPHGPDSPSMWGALQAVLGGLARACWGHLPASQSLWPPGPSRARWALTAPHGASSSREHGLKLPSKPLWVAGSASHPGSAPRGAVRSWHQFSPKPPRRACVKAEDTRSSLMASVGPLRPAC